MRRGMLVLAILLLAAPGLSAQEVPTRLLVRAVAHDAKIIGSGVGGARITVRDAGTGRVLASGIQQGSTGSTDAIAKNPVSRGGTVYDTQGAAQYLATLALDHPTRVEVVAEGPLGTPQATQRTSKTLLMVPGVDVVGEGLILELNGFTVDIQSPAADAALPAGGGLAVRAKVTMLCGCPIEPGGLWDAARVHVTARLVDEGKVVAEIPLAYAGETSTFSGTLPAPPGDAEELQVIAVDAERANTGMATLPLHPR